MAGKVMETVFGKYHKYEIIRSEGGVFSSTTFSIYRDGKYWKGSFDSLAYAVEFAKSAG